jgi:uncharacterized protein DUF6229
MTIMEFQAAERTAAQWRTVAGPGNPAGPFYASGEFAEPDIVEAEASYTGQCSLCSASHTLQCC